MAMKSKVEAEVNKIIEAGRRTGSNLHRHEPDAGRNSHRLAAGHPGQR